MKKWKITLRLELTDFIIVSVKFSLCYNIIYQRAYFLICYGASCCFTVPHNQGLLSTGPPLNGIHFNVCVIYAKAYCLKPGCLSDDQIGDRGSSMEANKGDYVSV